MTVADEAIYYKTVYVTIFHQYIALKRLISRRYFILEQRHCILFFYTKR